MDLFDDNLEIKDALLKMFDKFNIPITAYTDPYFYIKIGPTSIPIPNIPSRVRIAKFHDIHHIITGYPLNWLGEAEIGAWEIATGCRTSFIAWFLNSGAMMVGLFINPKAVIKAFIRGRKTKTNLYYDFDYNELLNMKIKDVKMLVVIAD